MLRFVLAVILPKIKEGEKVKAQYFGNSTRNLGWAWKGNNNKIVSCVCYFISDFFNWDFYVLFNMYWIFLLLLISQT